METERLLIAHTMLSGGMLQGFFCLFVLYCFISFLLLPEPLLAVPACI